ncbi:MAG: hypothetical protein AAB577_02170 [Patescibacteria group bacterium]
MAYEVRDWKQPECSLSLDVLGLSDREISSSEIQKKYSEGGALNVNYRTAEAIAIAANALGKAGLEYGKDFIFKTGCPYHIIFDFCDKATRDKAERIIKELPGAPYYGEGAG